MRCFNRFPDNAPESGELEISFQIDRAGRVQTAGVSPAAVGGTPLGTCVIGVASSTHFPAQSAPVRFRIPVRVRRGEN